MGQVKELSQSLNRKKSISASQSELGEINSLSKYGRKKSTKEDIESFANWHFERARKMKVLTNKIDKLEIKDGDYAYHNEYGRCYVRSIVLKGYHDKNRSVQAQLKCRLPYTLENEINYEIVFLMGIDKINQ